MSAELALGLLEASGASLYVPAFYQPYIVNTLKKERSGLKKARQANSVDEILLSELVLRMSKLAKDVAG